MKAILILVLAAAAPFFAHAEANSGLACTMKYSSSGALSSYTVSSNGWLTAGKTLEGAAKAEEGGEATANTIAVSKERVDGVDFWSVKVLDANKNAIGVFAFPPKAGMKSVLPVRAVDVGDEDPDKFDTLEVTCSYTLFVG